jgi:hypothetical protein
VTLACWSGQPSANIASDGAPTEGWSREQPDKGSRRQGATPATPLQGVPPGFSEPPGDWCSVIFVPGASEVEALEGRGLGN